MISRLPGRGLGTSETRASKHRRLRPELHFIETGDRVGGPGDEADGEQLPVRWLPSRIGCEVATCEQEIDRVRECSCCV